MIIGNPHAFAIESEITHAYEHPGSRALGFFLIHIKGRAYGVRAPDATLLACSFDRVDEIIRRRGRHVSRFPSGSTPSEIADAYRFSIYAPDEQAEMFFAKSAIDPACIYSDIAWAPDGDEAFDDWSHVLLIDAENRVHLIGFHSADDGYHHAEGTLRDVWLDANIFYSLLTQWRDEFEAEWKRLPKIPQQG